MKSLTPERLAASAYRTLGLSASASQAQIDQAARRLRIWPDPNSVPPTPWDLPWLGPVARGKKDIEQALALLNEPATRAEERLLWFHGEDPKPWAAGDGPALQAMLGALSARQDPASAHDYALARLQLAMLHDPQFTDPDQWTRALQRLRRLSESDDYLAWLLKIEDGGDFEKRAQIEEISAAMKALPDALAGTLAARAQAALEDDDLPTASRVLALLRSAGGAPAAGADYQTPILDRLEDLVTRRCNQLHEDLERKFGRGGITLTQGQAFCGGAAKFYNESIDPVLSQVYELVGPESDRTLRARTAAAGAMGHMGQCWAACGRLQVAEQTLDAAAELGRGTPAESKVRGLLDQVRQALRRERVVGTAARPGVHAGQPAPGKRYKPVYNTTGGSGGWGGRSVLIVVILVALRGIASISSIGSSGSGSSSPSYTSPYSVPSYPSHSTRTPSYLGPGSPGFPRAPRAHLSPDGRIVLDDADPANPNAQPFGNPPAPPRIPHPMPYTPAAPGRRP